MKFALLIVGIMVLSGTITLVLWTSNSSDSIKKLELLQNMNCDNALKYQELEFDSYFVEKYCPEETYFDFIGVSPTDCEAWVMDYYYYGDSKDDEWEERQLNLSLNEVREVCYNPITDVVVHGTCVTTTNISYEENHPYNPNRFTEHESTQAVWVWCDDSKSTQLQETQNETTN